MKSFRITFDHLNVPHFSPSFYEVDLALLGIGWVFLDCTEFYWVFFWGGGVCIFYRLEILSIWFREGKLTYK